MTNPDTAAATMVMDRQVLHEVGQVMRALEANGPRTEEELALMVGAPYWERNRFRAALDFARSSGMVQQDPRGLLTAVG
jgi:hypothetical protein